jgi:hypothetical protein
MRSPTTPIASVSALYLRLEVASTEFERRFAPDEPLKLIAKRVHARL